MEALSIFAHRGGHLPSVHLDFDACSSRIPPRAERIGRLPHPLTRSIEGRHDSRNSRCGFSSSPTKVFFCEPRLRYSAASFALALAFKKGALATGDAVSEREKDTVFAAERVSSAREVVAEANRRIDTRDLARKLWDCKTAEDVDKVFGEMPELPPAPVYSTIIRGLGVDQKAVSAFAVMDWLKRKSKDTGGAVGPNLFTYNSLLAALRQSRRFGDVDKVLEDMEKEGLSPNLVTYNLLMLIYINRGLASAALDVIDKIVEEGLVPSAATYSTALQAYYSEGDASGALAFFVELRNKYTKGEICRGTDENWEKVFVKLKDYTVSICYKVMRQWLVKEGDPTAGIMRLLTEMDRDKVTPGKVEYERLLWACTREDHLFAAREFYRRLRDLDQETSLSVCNHVIWLMGKAKKWWAALEVYEDLLDKGPKPNALSYELITSHFNVLLSAARKRGIWSWGVKLIDKMHEKGLKPSLREWNAVLVACSKAAEAPMAVQVFRRMIEQGERPNIISYGALLSALEKGKLYDEALKVWDHMGKLGVKPNVHAYTILASIYVGKGELQQVDHVIQEMDSSGIQPTVITFNAIITACAKSHLASVAFEWYHRMKARSITPNEITYEMLVEALVQDAKPMLAYEVYSEAFKNGLQLSSRAYDLLLESCHQHGTNIDIRSIGPRSLEKKQKTAKTS